MLVKLKSVGFSFLSGYTTQEINEKYFSRLNET